MSAMPDRAASATVLTALSFDYGHKRIGVAAGQSVSATAEPLATLRVRDGRPDWDAITALVAEWRPQQLVLGRPRHADGSVHPLDDAIDRFANRLRGRYGLPVTLIDEHLSSYAAATEAGLDDADDAVHAEAARVILETWFAARRT